MRLTPPRNAWIDQILAAMTAAETGPSETDLICAPTLDHWRLVATEMGNVVLAGMVSGHPHLRSGMIATSQLIAIDVVSGWARTVSRWYRLGRTFAEFDAENGVIGGQRLPQLITFDASEIPRLIAASAERARRLAEQVGIAHACSDRMH